MRYPTDHKVGHTEEEWSFNGRDWFEIKAGGVKPREHKPKQPAKGGTGWLAFVLLLVVFAVCAAPPLARLITGHLR